MNDDRLRDLLRETADEVEPGDRLDAIRAATSGARRTAWGWWAAGGAGLVAASVVTAVALSTGGTPRVSEQDPADSPTPTPQPTATDPSTRDVAIDVWAYYVGETPDGSRLYRELRSTSGANPFAAAVEALSLAPLDPDYMSLWPADAIEGVSFDGIGDDGIISVTVDESYRQRPAGMSANDAGLAVEQVVRTLQEATQSEAAVQFRTSSNPIDQVLGVPTSEPLATGSDLAVLAHVSLSSPSEGQVVDNDGGLVVDGLGNSYEGNIVISIQRSDTSEVVVEEPTIAGTYEDRLFPFAERLNVFDLPAGDYVVVARTDDPSGEGRVHTDDRRITIVD